MIVPPIRNSRQEREKALSEEELLQSQSVEIPNDLGPHSTSLYYKIRELTTLVQRQQLKIKEQADLIIGLQKEADAHKRSQAFSDNVERELRKAHEKINQLEKMSDGIYDTEQNKIKHLHSQIEELKRAKEHEQANNRKNLDVFHQKIEASNYIEMENRINKEEIEELKAEKLRLLKETDEKIRKKEINNQNKYTQLKKKMVENLMETKKNVTNLNLEYIDVSNKLTVLQNHQLIIQLEYQAEKIEELEREKDSLHKKVLEFQREIKVHKKVELSLADKLKSAPLGDKSSLPNDSQQLRSFTEYNVTEMQKDIHSNHLEKRLITTEKHLNEKTTELERLKLTCSDLKNRINQYEKRYANLFHFFEDSLNRFFQDEELAKNSNLSVNIDQIRKCDFTIFSNEEKYALIVLMMKYLLPIVSLQKNSTFGIGNGIFETNLNIVNRNNHSNEKYLKDQDLRKAFVGKNNKIRTDLLKSNISYSTPESIPLMKKTKSEADPRILDSKYKAVFT